MSNFRSPKLLDLARECPRCMACGQSDETIVAAHAPFGRDKGMSLKPSDVPAYVCMQCHDVIDGRGRVSTTKHEREWIYLDAVWKSVLWLLQEGHLRARP